MLMPFIALAFVLRQNSRAMPSPEPSLYEDCKVDISISNHKIEHPDTLDGFAEIRCLDYLHGFLDGVNLGTPKSICVPDGTKITDVARGYVRYIDQHPGQKNVEVEINVFFALTAVYPCTAKK